MHYYQFKCTNSYNKLEILGIFAESFLLLPIIETLPIMSHYVNSSSKEIRQDLSLQNRILDDGLDFVFCHAAVPETRSLGKVHLGVKNAKASISALYAKVPATLR